MNNIVHCTNLHQYMQSHCFAHWDRDKMTAILQTTFTNSYFTGIVCSFKYHWNRFPCVQLSISHNDSDNDRQPKRHYLNQWWFGLLRHICVTRLDKLERIVMMDADRDSAQYYCQGGNHKSLIFSLWSMSNQSIEKAEPYAIGKAVTFSSPMRGTNIKIATSLPGILPQLSTGGLLKTSPLNSIEEMIW